MADLNQFRSEARDLISVVLFGQTQQGVSGSDYFQQSDSFQTGETKYQLRVWQEQFEETADSNTEYVVARAEIVVNHHLIDQDNEQGYTEGDMPGNQAGLLQRDTWRALASVDTIADGPIIEEAPTREGNVIGYEIQLTVWLTP